MAWQSVTWPAPPTVKAVFSDRKQGHSSGVYQGYNLGKHVGDAAEAVAANRADFAKLMPQAPLWLEQIHSTKVVSTSDRFIAVPQADAAVAHLGDAPAVVMTADCLPVLLCNAKGSVVAAAHAGWRGLAEGVIENTVAAMRVEPSELMVWLGPAIGPQAFEVGEEVKAAFEQRSSEASSAFQATSPGKYLANLYLLAEQRLRALGISQIYSDGDCTFSDEQRYFSYRRDGQTGRMACAIWLEADQNPED